MYILRIIYKHSLGQACTQREERERDLEVDPERGREGGREGGREREGYIYICMYIGIGI